MASIASIMAIASAKGHASCIKPILFAGRLACGAALWALIGHAQATPAPSAWRCADASGQVTYSQRPCADEGVAQAMQVQDRRSTAQQYQSQRNQKRDTELARRMRLDRLQAERMTRTGGPVALSSTKPHKIKSTPRDHKPVPISDQTRPIKIKAPAKKDAGGSPSKSSYELGGSSPLRP